jgi:transposase
MKQKIPNGIYSKELREQAVKLVVDEGLNSKEAAKRLLLPPSTLGNWLRAARAGSWSR